MKAKRSNALLAKRADLPLEGHVRGLVTIVQEDRFRLETGKVRMSEVFVNRLSHGEEAAGMSAVIEIETFFQTGAVAAGEIDHRFHTAPLHDGKQLLR